MTDEPLCTAKEIAEDVGCSVDTVYRKAQRGEIPVALKIGPRWRFNREAVRAAMAPKTEEAES